MKPKFTIVIPNYNMQDLVGDAIESALTQRFDAYEVVVLDNASTDKSWEVINSFQDKRLKCFRQVANLGMYANLNVGTMLAEGEYIKVLCSDDLLHQDCLRVLADVIADVNTNAQSPLFLDHDKQLVPSDRIKNFADWKMQRIEKPFFFDYSLANELRGGLSTSCVPTAPFRKFGGFGLADPARDFSRDLMRFGIFSHGCRSIQIDAKLLIQRVHPGQNRNVMPKRYQLNEIYSIYRETGLIKDPEIIKRVSRLAGHHLLSGIKSIPKDRSAGHLLHAFRFAASNRLWNRSLLAGIRERLIQPRAAE